MVERSEVMRRVKSKNTTPELVVRKLTHSLGFRYRLHRKELPGKPDLVFPSRRKIIFVNGCFWHGHHCTRGNRLPKKNVEYWLQKIKKNKNRDLQNIKTLREIGWNVMIIWECEINDLNNLTNQLKMFLNDP